MATPINLVYFNVAYTSSVAYVSWNMNLTTSTSLGGPSYYLTSLGITATNVNTLVSTYYNLTLTNYTTSTSVNTSVKTITNRYNNATMYNIDNGGIINYLSLVNGQTYNFSGIGLGYSQINSPPFTITNLTSAVVYATGSPLLVGSAAPVCFLKGTKILCANGEYIAIENLEKGMLVKTHLHGDVAVDQIGHMTLQTTEEKEDKRDQLFVYKKEKNPSLTEDLILTGGHSALVDSLTEKEVNQVIPLMGQIYMTDDKFRLLACVDERAELYEEKAKEEHTIYHLCLEHPNPEMNYGVWANGMLMETCQKVCMEKHMKSD